MNQSTLHKQQKQKQTNQSTSGKQTLAFIYLRCTQTVTFTKRALDDSVTQIYTDFHIILAGKKETLKKIKRINMNIVKTFMNNIGIRSLLKNLQKYEGEEDFINRIEEICSPEKLSAKEVTYILVIFLKRMFSCQHFSIKIVLRNC